jgi:hypothetical protein
MVASCRVIYHKLWYIINCDISPTKTYQICIWKVRIWMGNILQAVGRDSSLEGREWVQIGHTQVAKVHASPVSPVSLVSWQIFNFWVVSGSFWMQVWVNNEQGITGGCLRLVSNDVGKELWKWSNRGFSWELEWGCVHDVSMTCPCQQGSNTLCKYQAPFCSGTQPVPKFAQPPYHLYQLV